MLDALTLIFYFIFFVTHVMPEVWFYNRAWKETLSDTPLISPEFLRGGTDHRRYLHDVIAVTKVDPIVQFEKKKKEEQVEKNIRFSLTWGIWF